MGQLTHPCPGRLLSDGRLDCLGHLPMGPASSDSRQALVQRVLRQSVRERVTPWCVRNFADEGGTARGVEDVEQLLLVEVGHGVEQVEGKVPSNHRCHGKDPSCLRTEPADAGGDDFSHTVGQHHLGHLRCGRPSATLVLVDGASLHETPQHLTDEEWVALGLEAERMGEIRRGILEPLPGCSLHECEHTGVIEALQFDPADIWFALQGTEEIAEWVGRRELGVGERPEHEQPSRLDGGDDMTQESEALTVGPLQVVEHEHDRLERGCGRQEACHRPVEEVALAVGIRSRRCRNCPQSLTERGDHRYDVAAVDLDVGSKHVFGRMRHVMVQRIGEGRV